MLTLAVMRAPKVECIWYRSVPLTVMEQLSDIVRWCCARQLSKLDARRFLHLAFTIYPLSIEVTVTCCMLGLRTCERWPTLLCVQKSKIRGRTVPTYSIKYRKIPAAPYHAMDLLMRVASFTVTLSASNDLTPVKTSYGILRHSPYKQGGCVKHRDLSVRIPSSRHQLRLSSCRH